MSDKVTNFSKEQEAKLKRFTDPTKAILELMNELAEIGMEPRQVVLFTTGAIERFSADRDEPSLMTNALADLLDSVEQDLLFKTSVVKTTTAK